MIHKTAITEYAKRIIETDRKGNLKNTEEDSLRMAKSKYLADFNNYALEQLNSDIVFSVLVNDYFEIPDSSGFINDIARIGELLSRLHG